MSTIISPGTINQLIDQLINVNSKFDYHAVCECTDVLRMHVCTYSVDTVNTYYVQLYACM